MLACTRNPDVFQAWDSREDVRAVASGIPEVVKSLTARTAEVYQEYSSKVSLNGLESIRFNPANADNPFTLDLGMMVNPLAARQDTFGGRLLQGSIAATGGGTGPIIPPSLMNAVEALNQQYRVMSNYMPQQELEAHFLKMQEDAIAYAAARNDPAMMRALQEEETSQRRAEAELQDAIAQEEEETEAVSSTSDLSDEAVVSRIIEREGTTFDNDKAGGPTRYGITQTTLGAYRGTPATVDDVKNLSRAEAEEIYHAEYIKPFDKIAHPAVREAFIDAGVNHGVGTARKWATQFASEPPLVAIQNLMKQRRQLYLQLDKRGGKYAGKLRGWLTRLDRLEDHLFEILGSDTAANEPAEEPTRRIPMTRVEPGLYEDSVTGRFISVDDVGRVVDIFSEDTSGTVTPS